MSTTIMRKAVGYRSTSRPSILKQVLEELDITPFVPESVADYKGEKLHQVESKLRPTDAEKIKERDFCRWEYFELQWLQDEIAMRGVTGDEPVIRFWKTPRYQHVYTYLQWVRVPLEKAADVPEFVKAKATEIASHLPDATFTVEELRSQRRVYDPFLVVSYRDESYYVEVWDEAEFERKHT